MKKTKPHRPCLLSKTSHLVENISLNLSTRALQLHFQVHLLQPCSYQIVTKLSNCEQFVNPYFKKVLLLGPFLFYEWKVIYCHLESENRYYTEQPLLCNTAMILSITAPSFHPIYICDAWVSTPSYWLRTEYLVFGFIEDLTQKENLKVMNHKIPIHFHNNKCNPDYTDGEIKESKGWLRNIFPCVIHIYFISCCWSNTADIPSIFLKIYSTYQHPCNESEKIQRVTDFPFPDTLSWVHPASVRGFGSLWTPSACPWLHLDTPPVLDELLETEGGQDLLFFPKYCLYF